MFEDAHAGEEGGFFLEVWVGVGPFVVELCEVGFKVEVVVYESLIFSIGTATPAAEAVNCPCGVGGRMARAIGVGGREAPVPDMLLFLVQLEEGVLESAGPDLVTVFAPSGVRR